MQKASTSEHDYIKEDIKDTLQEIEEIYATKEKAVTISITTPLLTCPIHIEKEKFILLIQSLIDTTLTYSQKRHIHISYRVITGNQLIFYIRNTDICIPEAQRQLFIQQCNKELEKHKDSIETMNGSIGVEFTAEKKITFWFTIFYRTSY
ncbi:histidine kinase [Parabacteroides pacaensis]|uniref:HAMP domain-containing histidine kinase n=1 Tax=Parabacteroides pacaensis TaxID=2086575 RepID=UPI000D0EEB1F|nr:HAMP domain-containing histidine kinase [Parabacteroides pacaensis]